jgi:hypothetical protein
MKAYKLQFTEDELVCLAQVFVNIELMGCRYPSETMEKVAKLAESIDVVKTYRESRRTTLKRTFIQAEDAVAMKYNKSSLESNLVTKSAIEEQPASTSVLVDRVIPTAASLGTFHFHSMNFFINFFPNFRRPKVVHSTEGHHNQSERS